MPIGFVTRGTKEKFQVLITDRENAITELSGSTPTFDVLDAADVAKYTAAAATASGLVITCLVDTSAAHAGGLWAEGDYRLFVRFTVATEVIRKGPFDFRVVE